MGLRANVHHPNQLFAGQAEASAVGLLQAGGPVPLTQHKADTFTAALQLFFLAISKQESCCIVTS